jgi:hypothetical protein
MYSSIFFFIPTHENCGQEAPQKFVQSQTLHYFGAIDGTFILFTTILKRTAELLTMPESVRNGSTSGN